VAGVEKLRGEKTKKMPVARELRLREVRDKKEENPRSVVGKDLNSSFFSVIKNLKR